MTARLSIVVLTYNRHAEVRRTLHRLRALPERPPIIVVDNASSDGTAARLRREFADVQVLRSPGNLGAAGRNLGVQAATTPYVALCDDDCCWQPGSLAMAERLLDAHPRIAVASARVLVGRAQRPDPACTDMAASPLPATGLPGPALLGFLAGASVVRRQAFLEAGGFEPRLFIGAEESLLALDIAARGWQLVYAPQLAVRHHPSRRREAARRRWLLLRNELWVAWLRRPLPGALARSADVLRRARSQRVLMRTLLEAGRGVTWVLRERRVVTGQIERWLQRLERRRPGPLPCPPVAATLGVEGDRPG